VNKEVTKRCQEKRINERGVISRRKKKKKNSWTEWEDNAVKKPVSSRDSTVSRLQGERLKEEERL